MKRVQNVFDFVFWVTHLVRPELKVCSAPCGTSAAGPSEHSAAQMTTNQHKNLPFAANAY